MFSRFDVLTHKQMCIVFVARIFNTQKIFLYEIKNLTNHMKGNVRIAKYGEIDFSNILSSYEYVL